MKNPFDAAPTERTQSEEALAESVFSEWCKMFGVDTAEIPLDLKSADKIAMYDAAFLLGAKKFLSGFLSQMEDSPFDIRVLKSELDDLRTQGDLVALGKREQEIATMFQKAVSAYRYEGGTNHPVDILARKEMNCVGASLIGGMLLEEVGICCMQAGGGSHAFLIVVTSDNKVLWQDMQDGKEMPELNNQELTAGKITGTDKNNVAITPLDIVAFARNPKKEDMNFVVNIEHWKVETITIKPFLSGIEEQELINTGFVLTYEGKHKEALEVLGVALQKSPNAADVHLGLAKALRGLSRYEEAIAECKKALELDPTYSYVQDEMNGIIKQLAQ